MNIGSKVQALQRMALDIYRLCLLASVSIAMQWIPGDLNVIAEDISNFVDLDDYSINDGVFYFLDELWGPHACDRFACHYIAKLPKFNTRFYQPGPPVSMPLRKIGPMTTTGCVPPRLSNL